MRRDLDLCRDILLELARDEQSTKASQWTLAARGDRLKYHVELLIEAGYATAKEHTISLTWQGCEVAALLQREMFWREAMRRVEQVGGAPFDLVIELLHSFVEDEVFDGTA